VKEVVENALDAGASRIAVAVDGDGTERIEVRDDGAGMSEADLRIAVRQHTTSKVVTRRTSTPSRRSGSAVRHSTRSVPSRG
jgi:DNA mismatch repair ATPase MutL